MTTSGADVVIVGAGVMGCASALALARRGVKVRVLERSVPGAEASSAAAGMLAAQVEVHAPGPFFSMCLASRERFADWADDLRDRTGIDIEFRRCGILRAAFDQPERAKLEAQAAWQREAGLSAELVDGAAAREVEPHLSHDVVRCAYYRDEARVDPPRLLKALRIAADRAGAAFTTGSLVRRVAIDEGKVRGVEVEGGELYAAEHVVVAAGSWSNLVPGVPLGPNAIRPARGQMVEVSFDVPPLRGIVWGDGAYLSPRDDGRVLVGATMEFVGFERSVKAGAVRDLLDAAIRLVPGVRSASVERFWSAFRPHTPDGLPLLGGTDVSKLWLATGHFRNGILLSPITAEIVVACILGEAPPLDPRPFELGGRDWG